MSECAERCHFHARGEEPHIFFTEAEQNKADNDQKCRHVHRFEMTNYHAMQLMQASIIFGRAGGHVPNKSLHGRLWEGPGPVHPNGRTSPSELTSLAETAAGQ